MPFDKPGRIGNHIDLLMRRNRKPIIEEARNNPNGFYPPHIRNPQDRQLLANYHWLHQFIYWWSYVSCHIIHNARNEQYINE